MSERCPDSAPAVPNCIAPYYVETEEVDPPGRKIDQGVLTRLVLEETRCSAIHKIMLSEAVKKGAGVGLALPLNHAAFPRNAAQLRQLGAGYTNCAPTPEARLLRSFSAQAAEQRKLLG